MRDNEQRGGNYLLMLKIIHKQDENLISLKEGTQCSQIVVLRYNKNRERERGVWK
jgi:hypothetical protein